MAFTVDLQVRALREAFATDGALVRFLTSVHTDVLDEVCFFAKGLDTLYAFERSGERVRFDVIGQEAEAPEAFATV